MHNFLRGRQILSMRDLFFNRSSVQSTGGCEAETSHEGKERIMESISGNIVSLCSVI